MTTNPVKTRLLWGARSCLRFGVAPALRWLRRELDAARRDTMDAQFMATSRASAYPGLDGRGW
jgi:hypothetical protein